ncbi:hypothetical protein F2P81_021792 [Scophthalmus maximus]|uniref:Uncharacterized protein n=1 Tax=Scophthalmus maximus TaxID=52904 RepID=A0A6A4S156_SCOMX|nr:hypothetical protein F2P81_021792 [Scophthalmus maximus]
MAQNRDHPINRADDDFSTSDQSLSDSDSASECSSDSSYAVLQLRTKSSPDPPQNCSEKVGEILVRVMDLQKGTDMKQLFGAEVEVRHVHVANSTSKLKLLLYEDQVQQLQQAKSEVEK